MAAGTKPAMKIDGWIKRPLADVPAEAKELEALGYDGAFTFEGPHGPFFPLALAAEHTQRLQLMTNIAVAFARSPMELAAIANDLQLASQGRFALGVGSQVRPHIEKRFSMPWSKPVQRMGELVSAIKAIHHAWNTGEALQFRGEIYRHTLMTPFFSPGPNPYGTPPIYVAALGPRMTAKAAEVGDGLLVHPFNAERYVRDTAVPAIDEGLARAGKDRKDFTVAITAIVSTGTTDAEQAEADAAVRRLLSFYGSTPAYRVTLEPYGWGDLQGELNVLSKQGRWDDMVGLIGDDVLETVAIRAKPSEVLPEAEARYGGVADRLSFSMPYEPSRACIEELLGR